jgi:hypothetical protein
VGENTWEYGLQRYNNGLFHGIAGNGYMLHTLFRAFSKLSKETENKAKSRYYATLALSWRTKAFLFAKALGDPAI